MINNTDLKFAHYMLTAGQPADPRIQRSVAAFVNYGWAPDTAQRMGDEREFRDTSDVSPSLRNSIVESPQEVIQGDNTSHGIDLNGLTMTQKITKGSMAGYNGGSSAYIQGLGAGYDNPAIRMSRGANSSSAHVGIMPSISALAARGNCNVTNLSYKNPITSDTQLSNMI